MQVIYVVLNSFQKLFVSVFIITIYLLPILLAWDLTEPLNFTIGSDLSPNQWILGIFLVEIHLISWICSTVELECGSIINYLELYIKICWNNWSTVLIKNGTVFNYSWFEFLLFGSVVTNFVSEFVLCFHNCSSASLITCFMPFGELQRILVHWLFV